MQTRCAFVILHIIQSSDRIPYVIQVFRAVTGMADDHIIGDAL